MEKIDLNKFSQFEIRKSKLKFVSGGSDTCTGGGMIRTENCIIEYDSDEVCSDGHIRYGNAVIICD